MNITVVTKLFPTSFNPYYGIFTKRFFDYFCSRYPDENVTVIRGLPFPQYLKISGDDKKILRFHKPFSNASGYDVHYPKMISFGPIFLKYHHYLYYSMLDAFIKKNHIITDIFHAYWLYPDGYVTTKLGKKLKKPVIVHCLGSDVNEQMFIPELENYHRYTLENCDAVIVCSNEMKKTLLKRFPAIEDKIHLVYNAVDREYYFNTDYEKSLSETGLQKQNGIKLILFAGKISKQKGVWEILSAIVRLKEKRNDFIVYMIGVYDNEREINKFNNFIEDNNIAEYVKIIGTVPDMKYWYRASDLYVLPTYSEGLPLTLLESLATGVPAVTTVVGGIPEVMNNPILGRLIQPKDSDALVRAIEEMMIIKHDRRAVSEAMSGFDLKLQTENMYNLYNKIISNYSFDKNLKTI